MSNPAVCKLRLTIVDAHALGEPRKGGQRQRQQGVHRAVRLERPRGSALRSSAGARQLMLHSAAAGVRSTL